MNYKTIVAIPISVKTSLYGIDTIQVYIIPKDTPVYEYRGSYKYEFGYDIESYEVEFNGDPADFPELFVPTHETTLAWDNDLQS